MSATSMANVAIDRAYPPPAAPRTRGFRGTARAAEGDTTLPDSALASAIKTITTYIPTEVLTAYIAGAGIFAGDKGNRTSWFFFGVCAVAIPLVNALLFKAKLTAANLPNPPRLSDWPIWESAVAVVAFAVYAAAIGQGPFTSYDAAKTGFLVVVVTPLLGLVSSVFAPGSAPPTTGTGGGEPSPLPDQPNG